MPIKLLTKQEINEKKAQERRLEIEEGAKLARRVDNLRELAVQEEASLASFRAKTLKGIQDEINKLTEEKNLLIKDVNILRDEITEGTRVLKIKETELSERESEIDKRNISIDKRTLGLKILSKALSDESESLKRQIQSMNYGFTIFSEMRKETDNNLQESKDILLKIREQINFTADLFEDIEKELKSKNIEVALRERDISIKEERIKNTFDSLREKELQLLDREQTLEREFNRLKKKNVS